MTLARTAPIVSLETLCNDLRHRRPMWYGPGASDGGERHSAPQTRPGSQRSVFARDSALVVLALEGNKQPGEVAI